MRSPFRKPFAVVLVLMAMIVVVLPTSASANPNSTMPPAPTPPTQSLPFFMGADLILANAGSAGGAAVTDAPTAIEHRVVVVGQPRSASGSVLVFTHDAVDRYTPGNRVVLTSPTPGQVDFGAAVAIEDGAVLATAWDTGANTSVVHRFVPDGSGGYIHDLEAASPSSSAIAAASRFVKVAGMGDDIVVSERVDTNPGTIHPYGLVHVLSPDGAGGATLVTTETGGRTSPDPFYGNGDAFGDALAANDNEFVVGDPFTQPGVSGAVYVFSPDGAGGFDEAELISPYGAQPDDLWGTDVDIGVDVVAARGADFGERYVRDSTDTFAPGSSIRWPKEALAGEQIAEVAVNGDQALLMNRFLLWDLVYGAPAPGALNSIAAHNGIVVFSVGQDLYVSSQDGRCGGRLPTVVIGASYEGMPATATEGDDVIVGYFPGEFDARGGDDIVCVSTFVETFLTDVAFCDNCLGDPGYHAPVRGGEGDDILIGDRLYGGPGDDELVGTWGWGGGGNDTLFVSNTGEGGPGNDVIVGDHIWGGLGDDILFANRSARGDEGEDQLVGSALRNLLIGGDGNDLLWGVGERDFLHGGLGRDRISGGKGDDIIDGEGGSDWIYGGDGDDRIEGGSGADQIWANAGDDVVFGGGGLDQIFGGNGNDTIQGNHNSDIIYGGNGNDILRGAAGKDQLYGDAGNDQLFGGDNSDWLDGGTGADLGDGQRGRERPLDPGVRGCVNLQTKRRC